MLLNHLGKDSAVIDSISRSTAASEEGASLADVAHIGLGIGGIGAGVGEFSKVIGEQWRGVNNKWYDLKWGGNQYRGARSIAIDTAEKFHIAGKSIFYVDASISMYEGINDLAVGNYLEAAKSGLDIAMEAIGLAGPVGFGISTGYFAVDKSIGWDSVAKTYESRALDKNIIWKGPSL